MNLEFNLMILNKDNLNETIIIRSNFYYSSNLILIFIFSYYFLYRYIVNVMTIICT